MGNYRKQKATKEIAGRVLEYIENQRKIKNTRWVNIDNICNVLGISLEEKVKAVNYLLKTGEIDLVPLNKGYNLKLNKSNISQ